MKKRICVIGLGQFGREMAKLLAKECEVLAIDLNQRIVNEIAESVQNAVRLDARDFSDLSSVVTSDFDEAIVSVGENLEASILAVLHIKQIGIERIHAKALTDDHATILKSLGADNVIFPEREASVVLSKRIITPNILDDIPLGEGHILIELSMPEEFCGKTVGELQLRKEYNVYLIAIKDYLTENTEFLPGGDFKCKPSNSIVIIGKNENIERIKSLKSC